jgi:tetratricopeptide (TPR) repeat protein
LPAVLGEATDWGLLSPHFEFPDAFLRLQPILPYFLRSRSQLPEHAEGQRAVAFRQYYEEMSGTLDDLLNSKNAQQRQLGQVLVRLEYENLTALHLALEAQVPILKLYKTLSNYLDAVKDEQRGLALGEAVRPQLQAYSKAALSGPFGGELIGVLDDIAKRQLELKQYATVEASYQETLRLLDAQTTLGRETREKVKAGVLHNLGVVAQEQRQLEQAEQYYQQALAIFVEFNDRYSQGRTLHQLGRVAQEQRQWGQARDNFLKALAIIAESDGEHGLAITLRSLGLLWQASRDTDLPHAIASILQTTPEDVETRLSSLLSEET